MFLLLGADSATDLVNWHRPERICELATVVSVNRGETVDESLLEGCQIQQVRMPAIEIASSDIRKRIRQGQGVRHLLPRAVEVYLQEHELYP